MCTIFSKLNCTGQKYFKIYLKTLKRPVADMVATVHMGVIMNSTSLESTFPTSSFFM